MEACYARLLLALVEADPEDKRQRLRSLAEEYEQLSGRFPASATAHFRLHIVYSELEECGEAEVSARASRELNIAAEMIERDPVLAVASNQWVRSTIRRRLANPHFDEAGRLRRTMRKSPPTDDVVRKYLAAVTNAFLTVYQNFPFERELMLAAGDSDPFFKLEAERRINNVVYAAALFLEVDPDLSKLHPQFSRDEMLNLTTRLSRQDLDSINDPSIVHTIGCAYNVLGHPHQARKAGDRLVRLIYEQGLTLSTPENLAVLEDASQWRRDAESALEPIPVLDQVPS